MNSVTSQNYDKAVSRIAQGDRSHRRYGVNQKLLLITLALITVGTPTAYLWYRYQLGKTADALLSRAVQLEQEGEWSKATSYYQRYLMMEPADTEALVRMVEAYAKDQPTPNRVARLTRLLYQALGRAPEQNGLRLMLAENLLDSGNYEEAEREATKLVDIETAEAPAARKVIALSKYARAQANSKNEIAAEVRALRAAAEESPGDVRLATVAAMALRQYPTAVEPGDKDPATQADLIMDRLVAANPKNVAALIARYQYRNRYKLADNECDLQAALEISPNDVDALYLSAMAALTQDDQSEQVETLLRRAIDAAPNDPRPYLALAAVMGRDDRSQKAIDMLRLGHRRTGENFDLGLALADRLITANDLGEAERVIDELQAKSSDLFVRLDTSARTQLENKLNLLRARLDLAQRTPTKAIPNLQAILLTAEASPAYRESAEWLQAAGILAQIAESREEWDRAASYWENIANVLPQDPTVVQSVAAAYLKVGNASAAIRRLDDYSRVADPTAPMKVLLVQAHLMMQLSRPDTDRNWTEFLRVLANAKTTVTDRWELVFAEVDYLLAHETTKRTETDNSADGSPAAENRQRASKILQAAESSFAGQAVFWQAAARAYQRMDRVEDADRALARYQETEPSTVKHAALQVALLSNDGKFAEADELLKALALLPTVSATESRQIQQLRVETLVAAGKLTIAHQLVGELIGDNPSDDNPSDAKLLALGIGISLELGDLQTAEKWEDRLGQQEAAEFDWRYLRTLRLLSSYDKLNDDEKDEVANSISKLRGQRPRWYPVLALAARHAQLNGDSLQALSDYRLAVDLGDRRASTLEQLVSLLYKHDRISEADEYLTRLTSGQTDDPILNSLAIQLAVKQDRISDALELARQAVEQHPNDVMRHIWLANLMLRNGQAEEAIQVFRQAAQRFPDDSQVWKGMLTLFVNTGRIGEARETLAKLLANRSLPDSSRFFLAAQGFEILGDFAEAQQYYLSALDKQPDDIAVRLRYAQLLLANNSEAARKQFKKVLDLDLKNGEALRGLAILLATTGREEDWSLAQKYLKSETDDSKADAATNDRLRAMLLSRRGRTRQEQLANCRKARDNLQKLMKKGAGESSDINRRLLASVYEREAVLDNDRSALLAAREQLRYLVDRENPSPEDLTYYIDFLMRHATSPAAQNKVIAAQADESLREVFLADAESRLRDLKRAQENLRGSLADSLSSVDLTVRLLQAQGRDAEASEYVAKFLESHDKESQDEAAKAQLLLMTGRLYSTLGNHAEAERSYRQLMEIAPRTYVLVVRSLIDQGRREEAAELCMSIADGEPTPEEAIVLAFVMTDTSESSIELPEALSTIEATIATHPDDVALLQAAAVMRASRGDYDEAIATFRRLLEIDKENALAMNNLATLLAERTNQRAEALEYIERAIEIAGRNAALLDTQGTIFLKAGDYAQAISCLEEATAGGATDARYYFHLAAAYQMANRIDEAIIALQSSRKYGLKHTVLTSEDRDLLAHLDRKLGQPAMPAEGSN